MSEKPVKLGSGKFIYEEVEGWAQLPPDWELGEVPGIAVDSQDRVYAFCRSEHPVVVFDRDGRFLGSWGEGMFVRPHMILIGPDDSVYCVDDEGHRVHKCTTDGKLLMTIAPENGMADTGYRAAWGTAVQSADGRGALARRRHLCLGWLRECPHPQIYR